MVSEVENITVISYKKSYLYINLAVGIGWLIFGIYFSLNAKNPNFSYYGYFFLGFFYLIIFYHRFRFKYITITDDYIKINQLFGWKVKREDILSVRKFAGDYKIKTAKKEYTISGTLIDNTMVAPLENILQKFYG